MRKVKQQKYLPLPALYSKFPFRLLKFALSDQPAFLFYCRPAPTLASATQKKVGLGAARKAPGEALLVNTVSLRHWQVFQLNPTASPIASGRLNPRIHDRIGALVGAHTCNNSLQATSGVVPTFSKHPCGPAGCWPAGCWPAGCGPGGCGPAGAGLQEK